MANILERFSSIIKANINDLLDKAEDPSKMIDQYMRELTESRAEVKEATAGVMAEETRCKRLLDNNKEQVQKYEDLAKKALLAGNEDDARTFLAKKQDLQGNSDALQLAYDAAHENARKMREMHDKLVSDIEKLNARKESIKAKVAVAKTQDKVTKLTSSGDKAENAIGAFDRMEAKANAMLDKSDAMKELNEKPVDKAAELEAKYVQAGQTEAVDDDIARLKSELGLS